MPIGQLDLIHETGRFSRYDAENPADNFGSLRSRPIDPAKSGYEEISEGHFQKVWALDSRALAWPLEPTSPSVPVRLRQRLQKISSGVPHGSLRRAGRAGIPAEHNVRVSTEATRTMFPLRRAVAATVASYGEGVSPAGSVSCVVGARVAR
jgi:hypothetical protein